MVMSWHPPHPCPNSISNLASSCFLCGKSCDSIRGILGKMLMCLWALVWKERVRIDMARWLCEILQHVFLLLRIMGDTPSQPSIPPESHLPRQPKTHTNLLLIRRDIPHISNLDLPPLARPNSQINPKLLANTRTHLLLHPLPAPPRLRINLRPKAVAVHHRQFRSGVGCEEGLVACVEADEGGQEVDCGRGEIHCEMSKGVRGVSCCCLWLWFWFGGAGSRVVWWWWWRR